MLDAKTKPPWCRKMDDQQKALKSPLSAKCRECGEPCREGNKYCGKVACRVQAHFRRKIEAPIKAEAAGEAQKSIAKQILMDIEDALRPMIEARDFLKKFLGKSE